MDNDTALRDAHKQGQITDATRAAASYSEGLLISYSSKHRIRQKRKEEHGKEARHKRFTELLKLKSDDTTTSCLSSDVTAVFPALAQENFNHVPEQTSISIHKNTLKKVRTVSEHMMVTADVFEQTSRFRTEKTTKRTINKQTNNVFYSTMKQTNKKLRSNLFGQTKSKTKKSKKTDVIFDHFDRYRCQKQTVEFLEVSPEAVKTR